MNYDEYLSEEKYKNSKKKIVTISIIILIIGLLIGGSLISIGLMKQSKINNKYSEKNKLNVQNKLNTEKQKLIESVSKLEAKVEPIENEIKKLDREPFTGFNDAYYARKDKIEQLQKSILMDKKTIQLINNVLSESFDYCAFSESKNNSYTSKYCSIKNELNNISSDFKKSFDSHDSIPFYMAGAFIIISTFMVSGSVFMTSKRREILAFNVQQAMPIAEEGMGKMSDAMSKLSGDVAREISKGIEEGKAQAKVPHVVKCPNCGADNEIIGRVGKCEYCKSKISYEE